MQSAMALVYGKVLYTERREKAGKDTVADM